MQALRDQWRARTVDLVGEHMDETLLVGPIAHVFQVVKSDHQARWLRRTAQRLGVLNKDLVDFG